jgi:hypothetical protein
MLFLHLNSSSRFDLQCSSAAVCVGV